MEEQIIEDIPKCPICGSGCVRETKKLKSGIEVIVWVCSKKEKPACLD